jgi:hypothetical protein
VPCSSCSTYSHNLCLNMPCNNGFLTPPGRCKIYRSCSWGNQFDLCVKQGPSFCLHRGQTYIMGSCWDSYHICYPTMSPRDLVPAPVPLPLHIMTLPSPLVIAIPLDNLTPAPVEPALPQCPCTSAYPHMPQGCYKAESVNWKFNN